MTLLTDDTGVDLPILSATAARAVDVIDLASPYLAEPSPSRPSWNEVAKALNALEALAAGQRPGVDGW
jgi:hypothetical protein